MYWGPVDAEYIIDGVHIKGTWERDAYDDPVTYYDNNGDEIVLRPGSTWVALHPDTAEATVE